MSFQVLDRLYVLLTCALGKHARDTLGCKHFSEGISVWKIDKEKWSSFVQGLRMKIANPKGNRNGENHFQNPETREKC